MKSAPQPQDRDTTLVPGRDMENRADPIGRAPFGLTVIIRYRPLLKAIILKDLKLKYRGSARGFFSNSVTMATTSVLDNRALIKGVFLSAHSAAPGHGDVQSCPVLPGLRGIRTADAPAVFRVAVGADARLPGVPCAASRTDRRLCIRPRRDDHGLSRRTSPCRGRHRRRPLWSPIRTSLSIASGPNYASGPSRSSMPRQCSSSASWCSSGANAGSRSRCKDLPAACQRPMSTSLNRDTSTPGH